jgi:hypothetical protein
MFSEEIAAQLGEGRPFHLSVTFEGVVGTECSLNQNAASDRNTLMRVK